MWQISKWERHGWLLLLNQQYLNGLLHLNMVAQLMLQTVVKKMNNHNRGRVLFCCNGSNTFCHLQKDYSKDLFPFINDDGQTEGKTWISCTDSLIVFHILCMRNLEVGMSKWSINETDMNYWTEWWQGLFATLRWPADSWRFISVFQIFLLCIIFKLLQPHVSRSFTESHVLYVMVITPLG